MTSYGRTNPQASPRHYQQAGYGTPMAPPAAVPPAGTFAPGTKIQVGNHRVQIQKYLSEGGFAHVYLVKLPKLIDGTDLAVLKRVAVSDKEQLKGMRTEVETMKRLKGHRAIVTYIDSHASELKGGGYEVFLLMEFCDGGGLIDFMNTRLQHRLTEPEILTIFADVAEGVACMHYLKPALLHRDIKVENVLITRTNTVKRFKLCDFGSAAPPRSAPTTVTECRLMDEDVQRHTTLQYRSPEMVDVYRKQPIDEKSDIWALGVFLYKLCYYTTPFEDQGQLAILNASYKYPAHPMFSDRLKHLISSMLKENMEHRPNIYQVLKEACTMQNREIPIHNIYAGKSSSQIRSSSVNNSKPAPQPVGAVFAAPLQEQQSIPHVAPMRRGRPTAPQPETISAPQPVKPSKVVGSDPFAALDVKNAQKIETDELSSRFPSLDQFSLLHDQGTFNFESSLATQPETPGNQQASERLADEVFASSRDISSHPSPAPRPQTVAPITSRIESLPPTSFDSNVLTKTKSSPSQPTMSRAQSIIRSHPELKEIAHKTSTSSNYVSTGTMTSGSPKTQTETRNLQVGSRLDKSRLSPAVAQEVQTSNKRHSTGNWGSESSKPVSLQHRLSQGQLRMGNETSDSSPLPSADTTEPLTGSDLRTTHHRLSSTAFENSTLEFLREKENAARPSDLRSRSASRKSIHRLSSTGAESMRYADIVNDTERDFGQINRRAELSANPQSKNLLGSKFGDAFKRFENAPVDTEELSGILSSKDDYAHRGLTPIEGSVATGDRSENDSGDENGGHITAEMRREMERRQLEEEEARVEAAQAEYRKRMVEGGSTNKPAIGPKKIGGAARAASIQQRVQSLLSEDQKPSTSPRTAQGYGKYTDAPQSDAEERPADPKRKPIVPSKPTLDNSQNPSFPPGPRSSTGSLGSTKGSSKPSAPKKPTHLNTIATGNRQVSSSTKPSQPASFERLIALDLPGRPMLEMTESQKDDYIEDFTKRFPSLSTMELSRGDEDGTRRM